MASNEQTGGRNQGQSSWGQVQGGAASQQSGFQDVHRGSGYAGSTGQGSQGFQGASDTNERQRSSNSMQMGQRGSQPGSQPSSQQGWQQGSRQGSQQGLQRRGGYSQGLSQDPWSQFFGDAPLGGSGPFSLMRRMTQDMDRLFDALGMGMGLGGASAGAGGGLSGEGPQQRGLARGGQGGSQASLWSPHVEVRERQGKLVVMADLPGIRKEDINVEVQHDQLVLQGHRHQESSENEGRFYRSERSYGSFYRTIPLPEGIDGESARASFRDGVLEIEFRMPEQNRGRRLEIGDGGSSASPTSNAAGGSQGDAGAGGGSMEGGTGTGGGSMQGAGAGGGSRQSLGSGGSMQNAGSSGSMQSSGAGSTGSMTESGDADGQGTGASAASTQRDPIGSGQQQGNGSRS